MSTTLNTELVCDGMMCRNDAGTARWHIVYASGLYRVRPAGPGPHGHTITRSWLTLAAAQFAALALEADDIERQRRAG